MKKFEALTIVECPYSERYGLDYEMAWRIEKGKVISDLFPITPPRDVHDFNLCGVYHKAGVPFEIREIKYRPIQDMGVHEVIIKAFSDLCCESLEKKKALLLTGYCTFAPGIVGGIQRALGKNTKIGIAWLDSHADISTPSSLPNGILAEMPLSTILGLGLDSWRLAAGLEKPCDPRHILISDYRSQSDDQTKHIEELQIACLNTEEFTDHTKWESAVKQLASKVDVIYLNVDCDILDEKYVPGHIQPEPNGPTIETTMNNIQVVMETGKVVAYSMFNTYFDLPISGKDVTIFNGMKLIGAGLGNWEKWPID